MPTRTDKTVHVSLVLEKDIWGKLTQIAKTYDVSANFVVRRAIIDIVNTGRVPWPSAQELEKVSNAKFGAATPVYDKESEEPVKGTGSGRRAPASRAP